MKKQVLMVAALLALVAANVKAAPITYVHTSTWTAGGAGTKALAFQNTSANLDVYIHEIKITNASPATVTSGPMQFWVYGSTVVTHGGTSQVSFYAQDSANVTAPSYISVSTGPVGVVYEGKQSAQLPMASIIINLDETSTVLPSPLADPEQFGDGVGSQLVKLGRGTNRALVLEQRQLGATDWTAGVALLRIVYTVK